MLVLACIPTYISPIHVLTHHTHKCACSIHTRHTHTCPYKHTFPPPAWNIYATHSDCFHSLVHTLGVSSHKQMTYLHHVYTPTPHLHTASPFPPALSQRTDFPKQAPTHHVPCTHSHPPAPTLHVAPQGAPAIHCSLGWVPRREDS